MGWENLLGPMFSFLFTENKVEKEQFLKKIS